MTKDEFKNLSIGDIVSHALSPWANFIVFGIEDVDENRRRFSVIRIGTHENIPTIYTVSNSDEWHLRDIKQVSKSTKDS